MKKVIGIISYLNTPVRLEKLKKLITKCNELFNIPIIIIAQNWKYITLDYNNVTVYRYEDKLGIVNARKELRKKFLESDYDYLIMLDDDCELFGNSGKEYLKQIDINPNCFIEFKKTLLKLFAISKFIFEKVDYDDINPEKSEGFEDRIFVNKLRVLYPDYKREFKDTGLIENSLAAQDVNSTWYKGQNLKLMIEKTKNYISKNYETKKKPSIT